MALMEIRDRGSVPFILLLLFFQMTVYETRGAGQWGVFTKGDCIAPGLRKYYSLLSGFQNDHATCDSMPASVGPKNTYFMRPDRCVDNEFGVQGEFYVTDTSCDPKWGRFKDEGCDGKYRQYSSVLEESYGSWKSWCAAAPAIVRGIYFSRPTRCVTTTSKNWGEFDVYDPCCYKYKDELRRRRLLKATQLFSSGCSNNPDMPPIQNPNRISCAQEAIDALYSANYDPLNLIAYFWNNHFETLVPNATVPCVRDYNAILYNGYNPPIIRFIFNPRLNSTPFPALVVPVTSASKISENGGVFPPGTFAIINRANPPARIIYTDQLSGCSLAFAWNNDNMYIGHVRPEEEAALNRISLSNYLRQRAAEGGVFPADQEINTTFFIGGDVFPHGYDNNKVNFIGFVSSDCIRILLQVVNSSRIVVRRLLLDSRHVRVPSPYNVFVLPFSVK